MNFSSASRKAIGLLILVFVLGMAFGAVALTLVNKHVYGAAAQPQAPATTLPGRAVARLTQDLNLSPDQQVRINDILSGMQSGYNAIHQQTIPQIDAVREQGRNQIRQTLTPEQLPKFEEYLRKLDVERLKRAAAQAPAR